jgi:hypothetical protein
MLALDQWRATNQRVHEACRDMTAEWQRFIGRRIEEDFRLLQMICTATSPGQMWNAWTGFWQKAAADYAAQYSTIGRIAERHAGITPPGQTASETRTPVVQPQSKAA